MHPAENDTIMSPPKQLLRKRQLLLVIPIGKTTLYDEIAKGRFPRPIKIGRRASAWLKSEVETWIAEREAHRAVGPKPQSTPTTQHS
jgi:prophage regulatory protein